MKDRDPKTIFNDLKKHQKEIEDLKLQVHKELQEYKESELKYRIASTERVLSFVRGNFRKMSDIEVDTYLVHCLNKLNGNIDGVELSLQLKSGGVVK